MHHRSLAALLAWYYKLLLVDGYTPLEGIYAHQLTARHSSTRLARRRPLRVQLRAQRISPRTRVSTPRKAFVLHLPCTSGAITYLLMAIHGSERVVTAPVALTMYAATLLLTLLGQSLCGKSGADTDCQ